MSRLKFFIALAFLALAASGVVYASRAQAAQSETMRANFPARRALPNLQSCTGTPTIQYAYANPQTTFPGQVTTLYWGSVLGAQAAYLKYPNGNQVGIGTPGSQQVNPTQTTTYYIVAVCGSVTVQTPITVNVQGGPTCSGTPQLNGFSANPSVINAGQTANLSWGPVNNADNVQLSSQFQGGSGVTAPGNINVNPGQTTTYYLTAWCQGNSAQAQVTVTVNNAPTPTPVPPANSNQITELQVEKSGQAQFKVTVKYYWDGADAPAVIQSIGYNANRQAVTAPATTGILAGFYKYVVQTITNTAGSGAVTTVTACMIGSSGTDLVCRSTALK